MLAGLLFNLLIAVVQNAFEIMVRNSTRDWEDGLTVLMEDGFLRNLEDLRPGDDDGNDSDGEHGGGGGGGSARGGSKDGKHGSGGQGKPGAGAAAAGGGMGRGKRRLLQVGGKQKVGRTGAIAAAAAAAADGKQSAHAPESAGGGSNASERGPTAAALAAARIAAAQEAFTEQLRQLQERIRYDDDDAVKRSKLLEYLRALIDREVTILTEPMYRDWCRRRYGSISAAEAKHDGSGRLVEGEPRASPARPESNWLSLRGQMLQWREFSDGSSGSDGSAGGSGSGSA